MIPFIAAAAIPAIFQGIQGIKQARQANRINPVRPAYNIPSAVSEGVDTARMSANATIPGLAQAQNNLQAGTANAVRSAQLAGSGNNVLATIAAAQSNEANAMNNLSAQNAQFNFGQRQNLQNMLLQQAGYQDKAWQMNKYEPYQDQAAAKAALKEGAMHNINNSLSGLASVGIAGMSSMRKPIIPGLDFNKFLQQQQIGKRAYNDASNYSQQGMYNGNIIG